MTVANIAIETDSCGATDPFDVISFHGHVWVEDNGPDAGYFWSAYPAFGSSSETINAAIIAAASTVVIGHGYTIGTVNLSSGASVAAGEYATPSSVTAAIATATSGLSAAPSAGSAPSLALNTARRPSTTRGTRVTASGTWTTTLTASGVLELRSDSSSTPTTVRVDAKPAAVLVVGVNVTSPWFVSYDVPAGDFYVIATSGTGTFALTRINETAL